MTLFETLIILILFYLLSTAQAVGIFLFLKKANPSPKLEKEKEGISLENQWDEMMAHNPLKGVNVRERDYD